MSIPNVAVITRTKDRTNFLARAIKSVHAQTYKDYIHVIVNDGGDVGKITELIEGQTNEIKQRIQLFQREKSSGAPDTIFNESIDRVDSKYVAIHDDDDTWHPNFLSQTVAALESGYEGIVARTDKITESVDANGELIQKKQKQYMPDVTAVSLYRQCIDNQLTPISFIYSREAYQKVGKYDSTLPIVGDWEFGLRFLMKYDVAYVDPGYSLASYHHRSDSASKSKHASKSHDHRHYFTLVANRYLRTELEKGEFGPGYIMSKIKYDQGYISKLVSSVLPIPIIDSIKDRVRRK